MSTKFQMPELTPMQAYAIRSALKLVGAVAAAHSATQLAHFVSAADTIEMVLGLAAIISGLISGYKASTTTAIQQAAADTLPPGTVLPATTDNAPKATVMSPEGATEFIRKAPTSNPTITTQ